MEKRKKIIRASRRQRGRYKWEEEESDRVFLRDGDIYDDWMRMREEEMRVNNEE